VVHSVVNHSGKRVNTEAVKEHFRKPFLNPTVLGTFPFPSRLKKFKNEHFWLGAWLKPQSACLKSVRP
jgi:hypothetical protein